MGVAKFLAPALWLAATAAVVTGQGCSNTCPPINFGVVVPALCEGDRIDGDTSLNGENVKADVTKKYDVCFPNAGAGQPSNFNLNDFRGTNVVTVIANYYTGCNAGRRESGVFAHVAQAYYEKYGDRVKFVQSVKGGGTCDQWSAIYQRDASQLYPGSSIVPNEMPWSVDDNSYALRDQLFTSPFGHPAYVVLDGNLEIKHKFIGPCCGYEQYRDCTPDIAMSLDTTLSGYLDAILNDSGFVFDQAAADAASDNESEEPAIEIPPLVPETPAFDCEWSEWSACSIRCGPTPGTRIRHKDGRCDGPLFESQPCQAANPSNCNVEDGGTACVAEFGQTWTVREGVVSGLDSPRDVKFHPTPGYHLRGASTEGLAITTPANSDEAWIINGNNHTISIVTAIDTAYQTNMPRRDRGYYHYMINGTAISFNSVKGSGRTADRDTVNYWAICNDNSNTYTGTKEPNFFMGPTLYDSSPVNRNLVTKSGDTCESSSGEPCYFLHSDMLHEAPSCRGIVHDPETETAYGTVYWAFDSTGNRNRGQLVRFDFQQPHGPGSMDHSIASVRRYVEVELESPDEASGQAGVHAGMVVHPTRRELFIAVPGKNRILRVGADSGSFARSAREEYPIFSNRLPSFEYSVWECVDQEVFASDVNRPSGMALSPDGERLFVAERGTGMIHAYEVSTGALLQSIPTFFDTIGGMDFAPNSGRLFFVDDATNTLNSVEPVFGCGQEYASRTNPDYVQALGSARVALGLGASEDPFDLIADAASACTVDPVVPNATYFDQVHLDTGYASDNPDVQSVMAGMDAEAALLANRTDCGYDSELNFDALLLGGYYCHRCLPEQDRTCDGGGSCTNVQWLGYTCDNEYKIVLNTDSGLPGSYLLQTMNGTTLDASELVLKPGITYKFSMMVDDEEICLSTVASPSSIFASATDLIVDPREDLKVGSVSRTSRDGAGSDDRTRVVNLGCATKGGPLVWPTGGVELTSPQIYVNVQGASVFSLALDADPGAWASVSSSSSSSVAATLAWGANLAGLLSALAVFA